MEDGQQHQRRAPINGPSTVTETHFYHIRGQGFTSPAANRLVFYVLTQIEVIAEFGRDYDRLIPSVGRCLCSLCPTDCHRRVNQLRTGESRRHLLLEDKHDSKLLCTTSSNHLNDFFHNVPRTTSHYYPSATKTRTPQDRIAII